MSSPDTADRLDFLNDTVDLLWPGVGVAEAGSPMTVVPSVRTPRLLVPVRPRRAAADAVRRYTAQHGPRERAAGLALIGAIRAGLCERLPQVRSTAAPGESIAEHLREVLGRPVFVALALTHERPNRKPVLQVFDGSGRTIAFAKVGVSALAAQLVDDEAAALAELAGAGPSTLRVPEVLHHGRWHDLPVLVSSALPLRRAPRPDDAVLARAALEISRAADGSMADYLATVRARATAAPEAAAAWLEIFEETVAARDLSGLPLGAWHGDFTQWNCARTGPRLMVWDWERFAHPAPHGFDRLHFELNRRVRTHRHRFHDAAERMVEDAPELLAPWRLPAADARTVALLYLLDISLRYLTDDLRSSDPGGRVENWAFPVVRAHLERAPQPFGR